MRLVQYRHGSTASFPSGPHKEATQLKFCGEIPICATCGEPIDEQMPRCEQCIIENEQDIMADYGPDDEGAIEDCLMAAEEEA